MANRALAGLRVVEMTEAWVGPVCASMMGDLGADVVKVESYPRHSMTRPVAPRAATMPGEGPVYERDALHHQGNRNKRNVALDVRTPGGAEVLRRLVSGADLFLEGYSAGKLEQLGFGWEQLRALNPRLVMISLAGWGSAGPYVGRSALGSALDASSGYMAVRGHPDGPFEDVTPTVHSDATGSQTLFFAALTALELRDLAGKGLFVDLSQWEGLVWQFPGLLGEWELNRRLPPRTGNAEPTVVPHGLYPAAGEDEWVALVARDDREWAALASALGHPEWAQEGHEWATVPGRLRRREAVDRALAAATRRRPGDELADAVQQAGAVGARVVHSAQIAESSQLRARGWIETISHRWTGPVAMGGFLWRIEPDAPAWERPTALVGEHNDEVLGELGFSPAEVEELREAGALGDHYQ
ncbi:MAG: CoA transferase [Chloroflexi bacterium]|nr:CoA transferase [Chloroflexota bacterium]